MSKLNHVAIIMDGNGRWAQGRSHKRVWGHVRGANIVSDIIETADNLDIKALSLYAFSSENWSRPLEEITALFKLLKKFIIKERNRLLENNIQFKVIGNYQDLSEDIKDLIKTLENDSAKNTGMKLNFAFGYGSRDEIVDCVNLHIQNNPGKKLTVNSLSENLYTAESGDVDLLIRTGGDFRISNFLLWQCAYAELYFTQTNWPEFCADEFTVIVDEFRLRERRFGGVGKKSNIEHSLANAKKNKKQYVQTIGNYQSQ